MRNIMFAAATFAVLSAMLAATVISAPAGSALTRAEGYFATTTPADDIAVVASDAASQKPRAF
jgi:hypothetical protein